MVHSSCFSSSLTKKEYAGLINKLAGYPASLGFPTMPLHPSYLPFSLPHSLLPSIPSSLSPSLTPSILPSIPSSLSPSLPPSLQIVLLLVRSP